MRNKDGAAKSIDWTWTFFHRPVTLGGGEKFRKPLAAKRIFLPVLVESSWKTFRLKFSDGRAAHSVALHLVKAALKGETAPSLDRHQRVSEFPQFLRISVCREEYDKRAGMKRIGMYAVKCIVWCTAFYGLFRFWARQYFERENRFHNAQRKVYSDTYVVSTKTTDEPCTCILFISAFI